MKIGVYFKFGRYPQNNGDTKEPIEWLVLDVSGNGALPISRYGLDCKQYHAEYVDTTWEDCDLRKWLNNDFLEVAFSDEEQKKIKVSNLKNDDNPEFETCGGNSTKDLVFCLSFAEVKRYFKKKTARKCQPTDYSHEQGAGVDDSYGCSYWWLRSPGADQSFASLVDTDGTIRLYGDAVYDILGTVRPALRIILNQ